jgi:hypothetical protein
VGAGALQRHFTLFLAAFFLASSIHPSMNEGMNGTAGQSATNKD